MFSMVKMCLNYSFPICNQYPTSSLFFKKVSFSNPVESSVLIISDEEKDPDFPPIKKSLSVQFGLNNQGKSHRRRSRNLSLPLNKEPLNVKELTDKIFKKDFSDQYNGDTESNTDDELDDIQSFENHGDEQPSMFEITLNNSTVLPKHFSVFNQFSSLYLGCPKVAVGVPKPAFEVVPRTSAGITSQFQ